MSRTLLPSLLASSLLLAGLALPRPLRADDAPPPPPKVAEQVDYYPSEVAALEAILERARGKLPTEKRKSGLRVVAFGEYHETNASQSKGKRAGVKPASALSHFTKSLLPKLAPLASDLILETWITDGNCGKQESAAVADVKKTTERPKSTESELVLLVKAAKELGVTPHILKLSCEDYKALVDNGAEVDYEKLLKLITQLLEKKFVELEKRRSSAGDSRFVMVYGGALHNDLEPAAEVAAYSFGPAADKQFGDGYVEVDLYVPELVDSDPSLAQSPWYGRVRRQRRPGQAVVIGRSLTLRPQPNSYILLFPVAAKR